MGGFNEGFFPYPYQIYTFSCRWPEFLDGNWSYLSVFHLWSHIKMANLIVSLFFRKSKNLFAASSSVSSRHVWADNWCFARETNSHVLGLRRHTFPHCWWPRSSFHVQKGLFSIQPLSVSVHPITRLILLSLFPAYMQIQMRRTVRKLAKCFPTAIVSGRCRDKVHFQALHWHFFWCCYFDMETKKGSWVAGV